MADTLITCEVDFDRDGKQTGFLRVPHSVHRSAYGWITVPNTQVGNCDGPTNPMMAEAHDDTVFQIAADAV